MLIVLLVLASAEDGAVGAAFSAGLYSSISFLTILPPSADPFTSLKLMPLSFASFLARGEALILESLSVCAAGSFSEVEDSEVSAFGVVFSSAVFLETSDFFL